MTRENLSKGDRLKIAIGEVVISFQFIENELAEIICALLQMKEKDDVQRMGSAMSFRQKVDLVCEIYPTRRRSNWPELDAQSVKKALMSTEEFRNSIVHSFWYVNSGGSRLVWMRSKASLRSRSGLTHIDGIADINSIEKGLDAMRKIRDWYLGEKEELNVATTKIKTLTKKLTRQLHRHAP